MTKTMICDYCNKVINNNSEYITFHKKNYVKTSVCINCVLKLMDKTKENK
ncbi:hypothetical protein [Clostridioides difficile]|nr:hypothetical protein [Clostridioides difficile]AXU69147.1 hypothetical protein CDIF29020_02883 [Clostridioides difficile]AXU91295.1 hypothetical protein CDIF29747_02815 [Clostridioides difficile]MCA5558047.1 hypothetical protein [Clostridioides difficile]MCB4292914.1 hypothetical protein [Clostridioides difficile]MCE0571603.1 hypothetical protein [Clostridioides difficile]